ncbi:MAG TPA: metallophosphoesterase [Thermoanaerobaculia bacterium]|nr:metallophosphoesterase [Thermoanaerobaculia bacterium]
MLERRSHPHLPSPIVLRWSSLVLALLLLASLGGPAIAQTAADDHPIRIGIVGDQTFSTDIQASYGVLQQGVTYLSGQNLDVVLHVGDLVESSLSPAQVTALFNQATGILDQLPVPWFLTAGDHDVNPPAFQQDSPDRSREQLFQQLYGARVPAFAVHPYYSFDLNGYHFISLYSFGALDSDSRFGNIFLSQVYDDQFAFLKNDLNHHQNARGIIVWVHQPLWYHVSGWQRVHELLRQYPVAAVISGHFHYNQDGGEVDGIRYLTVGATGGFTKVGSRQAGDVNHVSVVTVSGDKVTNVQLKALDNQPLSLTPRVDMDRIQAMDVQLGNFFDFASANPVFVQGGQLLASCGGPPAKIQIYQIGDPTDLPLDVKIAFSTSPTGKATLSSPAFGAGQCSQVVSPTECVLPRTARTFISNYSSVDINEFFEDALWTSGLAPSGGGPQPGTLLNFKVTTTINGKSGTLFLNTTVSTTVQGCP